MDRYNVLHIDKDVSYSIEILKSILNFKIIINKERFRSIVISLKNNYEDIQEGIYLLCKNGYHIGNDDIRFFINNDVQIDNIEQYKVIIDLDTVELLKKKPTKIYNYLLCNFEGEAKYKFFEILCVKGNLDYIHKFINYHDISVDDRKILHIILRECNSKNIYFLIRTYKPNIYTEDLHVFIVRHNKRMYSEISKIKTEKRCIKQKHVPVTRPAKHAVYDDSKAMFFLLECVKSQHNKKIKKLSNTANKYQLYIDRSKDVDKVDDEVDDDKVSIIVNVLSSDKVPIHKNIKYPIPEKYIGYFGKSRVSNMSFIDIRRHIVNYILDKHLYSVTNPSLVSLPDDMKKLLEIQNEGDISISKLDNFVGLFYL